MSVKILEDPIEGYKCLYCSTTMVVFGPIFYEDDDCEDFLEWLPQDARKFSEQELYSKFWEWKAEKENAES